MAEHTEPVPDNGAVLWMIWDEARRQLVRQEAALDTLRNQALAALSVSAIVAGLFGSHLTARPAAAVVAATASFVVAAANVVAIIWPREWTFTHGLTGILRRAEAGEELESGRRQLHMGESVRAMARG